MRRYRLDEHGEPILCDDLLPWATAWEADRRVANEWVGRAEVSTVFLGIDHGWGRGKPVLWETMVFGGALDGHTERYTSRQDALLGHARVVELARDTTFWRRFLRGCKASRMIFWYR